MTSSGLAPRLPAAGSGQRIGLYGGSFNPAHAGHRHVSLLALRRLRLDGVWWLVSPGNPLKARRDLAPLAERIARARDVAADPHIAVTGFESEIGVRFTVDSLHYLRARRPDLRFVWIMGADSLSSFHRWRRFRAIARAMPMAIVDRPGHTLRPLRSRAALSFALSRIPEAKAATLADRRAPAWVFLHGPRSSLSSTALRLSVAHTRQ